MHFVYIICIVSSSIYVMLSLVSCLQRFLGSPQIASYSLTCVLTRRMKPNAVRSMSAGVDGRHIAFPSAFLKESSHSCTVSTKHWIKSSVCIDAVKCKVIDAGWHSDACTGQRSVRHTLKALSGLLSRGRDVTLHTAVEYTCPGCAWHFPF